MKTVDPQTPTDAAASTGIVTQRSETATPVRPRFLEVSGSYHRLRKSMYMEDYIHDRHDRDIGYPLQQMATKQLLTDNIHKVWKTSEPCLNIVLQINFSRNFLPNGPGINITVNMTRWLKALVCELVMDCCC